MWDIVAALVIVGIVAAYLLTFVIKDDKHGFYKLLGLIAKVVFGGMIIFILLAWCTGQFHSTDAPVSERQYPR